jgi:hypothetical protein
MGAVRTRGAAKRLVKNLVDLWLLLGHGHVSRRLHYTVREFGMICLTTIGFS